MMQIGVLKEAAVGERRVALAPTNAAMLAKAGWKVAMEAGAGERAGFLDGDYAAKGAAVLPSRGDVLGSNVLLAIRTPEAKVLESLRAKQILVAMLDPLGNPQTAEQLAKSGVTSFALELIPRITRAQSMDVLSSMATVAGYRAVLLSAVVLPQMFPLLMTAAGTITPARVFVIGAGVAGLQSIATAKRLGALVQGYDVRPVVREQVESLGAKFVELGLESAEAEDKGGYAKVQGEDFTRRQQRALATIVAASDVVISTAAIPGQRSPVLITQEAVEGMKPGSVIIDLAAERGGNCPLSKADEHVLHRGVTILGPTNLPSDIPHDASQMFGNNVTRFVQNLFVAGKDEINWEDEIVRETAVTRDGEIANPRVRRALGMEPAAKTAPAE
jgi:NAD(P) transhydrogenase subunit alpha